MSAAQIPEINQLTGVELIAAERQRQIEIEDWSPEHDDRHSDQALACAAAVYAMPCQRRTYRMSEDVPALWPWEDDEYRPTPNDRIRELTKAGALVAAEIDRLLRTSLILGAGLPHMENEK